jgi:hypothetical protein
MADSTTLYVGVRHTPVEISTEDLNIVANNKVYLAYEKYAYIGSKSLHSLVMGPRPADVPETWVIDHADRNKLNNTRENLRWVSKSFNAWNKKTTTNKFSDFRGVWYCKKSMKWVSFVRKYIGAFTLEKDAAISSAVAYVEEYGSLALNSDILFGPNLLTEDDKKQVCIKIEEKQQHPVPQVQREAPKGIYFSNSKNKYVFSFKGKELNTSLDLQSVIRFQTQYMIDWNNKEWSDHLLIEPTVDEDGDVAIKLTGKYGEGKYSKIDRNMWHRLTFNRKWCGIKTGYASGTVDGKITLLHTAVYKLAFPGYVSGFDTQIDHRIPEAKLDNRIANLRVSTHAAQMRNKAKRNATDTGSSVVGVHKTSQGKWRGRMEYMLNGKKNYFSLTRDTEAEVVAALNIKRIEIHGNDAVLG